MYCKYGELQFDKDIRLLGNLVRSWGLRLQGELKIASSIILRSKIRVPVEACGKAPMHGYLLPSPTYQISHGKYIFVVFTRLTISFHLKTTSVPAAVF